MPKKLVYIYIYIIYDIWIHMDTYGNIFLCQCGLFLLNENPLFTTNPLAIAPSHPAHREEQRVGAVGIQLLCHAFGGLRRVTHHLTPHPPKRPAGGLKCDSSKLQIAPSYGSGFLVTPISETLPSKQHCLQDSVAFQEMSFDIRILFMVRSLPTSMPNACKFP